ncbi:ABC transporter ATP-binding protein [Halobacteria archaeon AArc-curdl1]|uniref:ABC transporter ATP-binding protein n=1 Tax=Natronosalvus hydrolyticus TaxID=2979988 RepID=A0AAP2Z6Q4_9EURY|nr:ABC transporter ATP-binding protein [Halobacteria archaeon AArc-curdl1]
MATIDTTADRSRNSGDPIVEMRDTTVQFGMDRGVSRVLDGVSMDIEREEILGIVGESGSGKSMFASALLDAVVPPGELSGEITYHPRDGEPVDVLNLSSEDLRLLRWEEISMVFQGAMSSWNPTLKIKGHFIETLQAHSFDVDEGMERAHQLLSDLYLDSDRVLDSYPHELSGGMKQRALIALSMVLEPEVLVMDEPTAALDLLMQRSILKLLKEVKEKYEITLIFITHDLPLVAELADRLAVMYAFEFVEVGSTDDILSGASHPYTRALLNSTPNLSTSVNTMTAIEGSSPDPVDTPEGCSYHPRCSLATEDCRTTAPDFHDSGPGHLTACYHWQDAADEIPFNREISNPDDSSVSSISSDVRPRRDPDEEPVLELEDLEVHFGMNEGLFNFWRESQTVRAVDGISLTIPENESVALIGESGCGKTTFGKTAIGLQRPTGGSVKYRGQDIWDANDGTGKIDIAWRNIRRALQIIHQDPGSSLNPNKRVEHLLNIPLKKWQRELNHEDRRARILGMLEHVGMSPPEDYANRFPHQLSGGEKQRVALIRALLMNPDVILADESISALDVSLRIEMMDLFLELQNQFNTSFIFISHDLSNARYLTEKSDGLIGIMYLGELVEIGPAKQIIEDPRHPYTKALRWATPDLLPDNDEGEMPMTKIDIPDPKDPPSGCRFHTRCPEAREACARESPEPIEANPEQHVACFREDDTHEYWQSEPWSEEKAADKAASGAQADD